MIARAPIAARAIARRRRRAAAIGADFVVPPAPSGLAAQDRRSARPGASAARAPADDRDRSSRAVHRAAAMRAGDVRADAVRASEAVVRLG